MHRSDEATLLAEIRCGNCALWGTDLQDEERVDGVKHCPKRACWAHKNARPILGCFVEKEG